MAEGNDKDKKEVKKETADKTDPKKEEPVEPPLPPLLAAAKRLERLLSGSLASQSGHGSGKKNASSAAAEVLVHTNPCKIVKRWLSTSSGASSKADLADVISSASILLDPVGPCATGRDLLLLLAEDKMQTDETKKEETPKMSFLDAAAKEMECYLLSLATLLLWKSKAYTQSLELVTKAIQITRSHMNETSAAAMASASGLYPLLARLFRLQNLVTASVDGVSDNREELSREYRLAVLRRDVDTQATLLNLMLGQLLNASQVEQAQKLLANSTFPDSASNNQLCRYRFYSGRIQALRLEYTDAFSNLSEALRKAPTNTALGFRIAVQRLLIVVQLLMGEIPKRSVFVTEGMIGELKPYLNITQAVRRGDLAVFHETVGEFSSRLVEDGTYTLISRLAHSVVKAGLRQLNTSYARISLVDIAHRLGLANATSAEFVVAKAVRDGVIDATIYHEEGYVQAHELVDVYSTTEPTDAFHRRIAYCLTTHNDAVRGMMYPPGEYKKQLKASRGLRGEKDEDKTDEEKAQELEDELEEDY